MNAKQFFLTLICILGCVTGVDGAPIRPTSNDYHLDAFANDISLVARVVSGVAVAQKIRDGGLEKDALFGQLVLGWNQKMSSLAALNSSRLATNIEEIGRIVTTECGSGGGGGCGSANHEVVKDGINVLASRKTSLKPELMKIAADKGAFKELTILHDTLNAIASIEDDAKSLIALKPQNPKVEHQSSLPEDRRQHHLSFPAYQQRHPFRRNRRMRR